MDLYKEKVNNEAETITDTLFFSKFVDAFEEIKNWAEKNDFTQEVTYSQYEVELCSLCAKNKIFFMKDDSLRFAGKSVYIDGSEWPDVNTFSEDQFEYYELRLQETQNTCLKYRYSDFLFEYENKVSINKYELSKHLLSSIIELLSHFQTNKDTDQYIDLLSRLVEVSLAIGK